MADNDDKIIKILESMSDRFDSIDMRLDGLEKGQTRLETTQKEQGKKIDHVLDVTNRTQTIVEILNDKVDETKIEVDEIKKRQHPRHAD